MLIHFNKWKVVVFFLTIVVFDYGQKDIDKYIPYQETTEETHPTIEIRTIIHVIKKSQNDAENLTEDSLDYIHQQYDWINAFYRDLRKPTLPTSDGKEHYIPSARVKFKVENIQFHTDENDWDRIGVKADSKHPMEFISYDSISKELVVKGNWKSRLFRAEDSLKAFFEGSNPKNLQYDKVSVQNGNTVFNITSKFNGAPTKLLLYKEENSNCSMDLWQKYATDKNALHVFYTGSSKSEIAFGCGPSPYFLNVSNIIKGGDWAGAQLTAHELGHTIGLSHTDRPQFDDLPKHDKFGFIDCNSTVTSNNIMGYNICRNYLSPKQIGYVHSLYSKDSSRIVLTTANEYKPYKPIELWDDTIWDRAMVVRQDVVVRRGQTLEVNEQLHMASGATIYLEAKATLIVNGAVVTNYFGESWRGVKICSSYERSNKLPCKAKNYGKIVLKNGGKLRM